MAELVRLLTSWRNYDIRTLEGSQCVTNGTASRLLNPYRVVRLQSLDKSIFVLYTIFLQLTIGVAAVLCPSSVTVN